MSERLPRVFEMKRFFRALIGRSVGILTCSAPAKGEFYVRIDFDNDADRGRFYTLLSAVDPVKVDPS